MIFITGDIHSYHDIEKLNSKNFPEGKELTKNDYVICTGDFGLIWDVNESSKQEKYWIDWLTNKPWVTLFVDGNHENFDRLYQLKSINMFGGEVGKVNNSIFHLKRGEIYIIEDKKFLTMGGANSIDQEHRFVNISWWKEEIPSYKEIHHALTNLESHNNEVDYILTHTAPRNVIERMMQKMFGKGWENFMYDDPTELILTEIQKVVKFKIWFFGHFHENIVIDKNYICLYDLIYKIK